MMKAIYILNLECEKYKFLYGQMECSWSSFVNRVQSFEYCLLNIDYIFYSLGFSPHVLNNIFFTHHYVFTSSQALTQ